MSDAEYTEPQMETTIEVKTQPSEATKSIEIRKNGELAFDNHNDLVGAAKLAIKMKIIPESLIKDGVPAVMSALLMCKQLNLPIKTTNEMAYIKGKLSCYGSLVTTLAERHPEYGEFEEFFLDAEQEIRCAKNKNLNKPVWAAIYRVKRKGSSVWNEYKFTMDDAKTAGLLSNPVWQKYPDDMLMHKSRARALKANYASALNGVEYHEDLVGLDARDVSAADEVNQRFSNGLQKMEAI